MIILNLTAKMAHGLKFSEQDTLEKDDFHLKLIQDIWFCFYKFVWLVRKYVKVKAQVSK